MATNIVLNNSLANRLEALAERTQRPAEEIATVLLEEAISKLEHNQWAIIPPDTSYEFALQKLRPKLYAKARQYWQSVGNHERLALTDEQLDEQFWLIDSQGIPRLKSEQTQIELSPDPLLTAAKLAEEAQIEMSESNISERSRDILNAEFAEYLTRRTR